MGRALVRFFWSTCVLRLYFVFCDLNLLIYTVHLPEVQCAFFREARCFFRVLLSKRAGVPRRYLLQCPLLQLHTAVYFIHGPCFYIHIGRSFVFLKRNLYYEWIPFVLLFFYAEHRVNIVYVQNMMWYSASICCWKTAFLAENFL